MTLSLPILSSPRFWALTAIAVLEVLVVLNVLDGGQVEGLVKIIEAWLLAAVGVRTIDRAAERMGAKAAARKR